MMRLIEHDDEPRDRPSYLYSWTRIKQNIALTWDPKVVNTKLCFIARSGAVIFGH